MKHTADRVAVERLTSPPRTLQEAPYALSRTCARARSKCSLPQAMDGPCPERPRCSQARRFRRRDVAHVGARGIQDGASHQGVVILQSHIGPPSSTRPRRPARRTSPPGNRRLAAVPKQLSPRRAKKIAGSPKSLLSLESKAMGGREFIRRGGDDGRACQGGLFAGITCLARLSKKGRGPRKELEVCPRCAPGQVSMSRGDLLQALTSPSCQKTIRPGAPGWTSTMAFDGPCVRYTAGHAAHHKLI